MMPNTSRRALALPLVAIALTLSACGNDPVEPRETELETATTDGEEKALGLALPATDFASLQLGARIVGPQGPEVRAAMSTAEGNFADIRSYVACPKGMDPCDPGSAPEGTVYTYVHTVFPGEDNDATTGAGTGNDSSDIEIATAFKMLQPARGFTGTAGYSQLEVVAALDKAADVVITCHGGSLVWTINSNGEDNTWEQAEPITFFWQSTVPPAGPAKAYAIVANYAEATGAGPFPGQKQGAAAGCTVPAE